MKILIVFSFIVCLCSTKSVSNNDLKHNQKNDKSYDTFQYLTLQALGRITGKINALSKTIGGQQQRPVSGLDQLYVKLNQTQQELTKLTAQQKSNFAVVNKKLNERRYNPGRYVFHVMSKKGHYKMSFEQAKAACESLGAKLATLHQMKVAYKLGMDMCACGWLAERVSTYPAQWYVPKHCKSIPGTNTCTWKRTWDAYCFKYYYDGDIRVYV